MVKGYSWSPNDKLPTIEDHSLAKHEILRAYLLNYLRILAQNPNSEGIRVTIVDGFAGGGRYQTQAGSIVGGSPLILLGALQEARSLVALDRQQRNIRKPYVIHAHVHLIEQNADTCAYLRKVIAETPDASASNTASRLTWLQPYWSKMKTLRPFFFWRDWMFLRMSGNFWLKSP